MKKLIVAATLLSLVFGCTSAEKQDVVVAAPPVGTAGPPEQGSHPSPVAPRPTAANDAKLAGESLRPPDAALAPTPAAAPETGSPFPLRWSEQLGLASLADLANQLSAPGGIYGELSLADKTAMPKNCDDWARLHADGYEPSSAVEVQPDTAAKSRCTALRLLQRAKPAGQSFVRDVKLTAKVVSILPAVLASSNSPADEEKVRASVAVQRSLKEHDPKLTAKAGAIPGSLEITEGDGQSYDVIEALAWGDFDGDGLDDMLISVSNGASDGSVLESRVLALSRADDKSVLRVVELR